MLLPLVSVGEAADALGGTVDAANGDCGSLSSVHGQAVCCSDQPIGADSIFA